jgi:hypothetical protein
MNICGWFRLLWYPAVKRMIDQPALVADVLFERHALGGLNGSA